MWISFKGELTVRFWDLKGESNCVCKWLLVDQFSAEAFLHVAGTLKILSTFVMYFYFCHDLEVNDLKIAKLLGRNQCCHFDQTKKMCPKLEYQIISSLN